MPKLAVDQLHQVMISSRHPDTLVALADRIGCNMGTVDAAAQFGDLIVGAIPLKELDSLPARALAGKIVVDTMNYYPERDGVIEVLDARATTTSALVAAPPEWGKGRQGVQPDPGKGSALRRSTTIRVRAPGAADHRRRRSLQAGCDGAPRGIWFRRPRRRIARR